MNKEQLYFRKIVDHITQEIKPEGDLKGDQDFNSFSKRLNQLINVTIEYSSGQQLERRPNYITE